MALGLPVLASSFPLYRSVVEDNACGTCVDPLNETAIAEAIRILIERRFEAERMGERGRAAVQAKYSWDSQAEVLLKLYGELLS
jgi:glycosyltransferase involved in cell wall biosynthesis